MTAKQADKIVAAGIAVTVINDKTNETFTKVFTRRDHSNLYCQTGEVLLRQHLRLAWHDVNRIASL